VATDVTFPVNSHPRLDIPICDESLCWVPFLAYNADNTKTNIFNYHFFLIAEYSKYLHCHAYLHNDVILFFFFTAFI
jgi:hypothetical protein